MEREISERQGIRKTTLESYARAQGKYVGVHSLNFSTPKGKWMEKAFENNTSSFVFAFINFEHTMLFQSRRNNEKYMAYIGISTVAHDILINFTCMKTISLKLKNHKLNHIPSLKQGQI